MRKSVAYLAGLALLLTAMLGSASAAELPTDLSSLSGPSAATGAEGVFSEVLHADGTYKALFEDDDSPIPVEARDVVGEVTACVDDAHSLWGWRESNVHGWHLNTSSIPSGLNASSVLEAATAASDTVTTAGNSCGRTDAVAAQAKYMGPTTAGTNIAPSGVCGERDGRSVVGFGPLDNGSLAVACVWYSTTSRPWEVLESDVRISSGHFSFFVDRPVGCSNRFDLESILAHERGHTFGLGHVSEKDHGALTMSEKTSPCSTNARTLGLGDVVGLEALY
ncbi:MAG TPA: matrixin family metalloprotease [Actinomycetota bacterium]|nr:matrixin family metalloprotease [Actinomycetota bacterium]